MEATDNDLKFDDLPGAVPSEEIRELYIPQEPEVPTATGESEEPGFSEVFRAQRDDVHVVNTLIRANMVDRSYDPDFVADFSLDKVKQDLTTNNIPDFDTEFFHGVTNEVEYNRRMARAREKHELNTLMEQSGGLKAFGATMAAYATDPVGFAVDVAAGGSSKASLMLRFLESGGRSAAADMLTEVIRTTDGEAVSLTDVALGTLTAFGTGGLLGIPGIKGARMEAQEHVARQHLTDMLQGDRSVGAASNPDLPAKGIGETNPDKVTVSEEVFDKFVEEGAADQRFSWAQISHAARAQKSESTVVRKASYDVHGGGVERAGKVREAPMEMESNRLKEQHITPWYETVNAQYADYLKETQGSGFLKRQYSHNEFESFMEMVGDYRLGKLKDAPAQVEAVAQADQEFYKSFKETGIRSGAFESSKFSADPNWMPRVLSRDKLYGMMTDAKVRSHMDFKPLVVNAIRKGREAAGLEVDDQLTNVVATAYLNRAWNQGEGGLNIKHSGEVDLGDVDSLKELVEEFIPEGERQDALSIIDDMSTSTKTEEAGEISHMKSRLVLDHTATAEVGGKTFSMSDLYENNVAKLSNGYANKMSAELAFRDRGYTTKKFEKLIAELEAEASVNQNYKQQHGVWDKGKATPKDVDNLKFSLERMTHKGIKSDSDTVDSLLRISGNHTYAAKMGSAGLNAITESGTLLAFQGLKGFFKNTPMLPKLVRAYRKGNPTETFVAQVESLTSGAGSKLAENRASFKIQDDVNTPLSGAFGKVEQVTDTAKRLANETNLLTHITDISTRYSTAATITRLDEWANGKKMPRWWGNRSKTWGLGGDNERLIKAWLTGDRVVRGRGGGITDIGLEKMDYPTEKAFRQFIHRVNSNNIQKVYSGDLPRIMQTPMGQFIMKFRSFTTAAWGKHTLDDLNHMDSLAAQKLILTGGLGMFMYMNRSYLTHAFDEDKRKEAITLENALRSGATYAVNVSLLPALLDTTAEILNAQPIVGKKRTSGLQTGFTPKNFTSNVPGISMLDDMYKAIHTPFRVLGGGEVSKEQIRAIFSVLMLDTFWGTRGIRSAAVDAAPSERNAETNQVDLLKELTDVLN